MPSGVVDDVVSWHIVESEFENLWYQCIYF